MTLSSRLSWLDAGFPAALKSSAAGLVAVAVLQLGILGTMLGQRLWLLSHGREIVLKTNPVDPRDLLKGDFARLGYNISTLPNELIANAGLKFGKAAFVTLSQAGDGTWQVAKVAAAYPANVATNEAVLRAYPQGGASWTDFAPRVRYGIERYYVPEGTGHEIEKLARERRLEVIVALGGNGEAAIKGLSIDGKKVYDEPLY